MDQGVLDARAKLKERFGNTQIGGKGKLTYYHTALSDAIKNISFYGSTCTGRAIVMHIIC